MKKKYLFLSFIIPLASLLFVLIFNNVIFGDYSIFFGDAQYQYQQLLIYFKNVLSGVSNPIYSLQVGFGGPMLSTIAYYLLSPTNLFLSLFSYENIEIFFIINTLVKISLCGLTMFLYLNYQNKNKYSLIFSTCYALSFYIIINYYQMMWLDSYFLAPLLFLGIDKLIKEKKFLLYSITLFVIILTNYYMGYMCAVFSVLYFMYKYLLLKKKDKKVITMFLITSILSGLMTMFLHIPNLLYLMNIPRIDFRNYLFNTDVFGILSKLYLGSNVVGGTLNEYHPYLYIGLVNIILLFFYFINSKISIKERILSLIVVVILLLSIVIVPLNNFWHAFSTPIGFNFRYMYLFNIFFISLCYKSFLNIKSIDKKWYYIFFLILIILSNLIIIRNIMNLLYIYISVVLILFYLILFRQNNLDSKILLVILVFSELIFNGYSILKSNTLTEKKYIYGVYNEKISSIDMIKDSSLYRMEFYKNYGFNDSLNFNYYGVTGWLSSFNINSDFYNKIGYYSTNNMGFYNESIVLDSLLGIKYYETWNQNDYYELIGNNRVSSLEDMLYGVSYVDTYIYKNPYYLNLGYMVSNKVKEDFLCENGFDCQNNMMNNMIGLKNDVYTIEKIENNIVNIIKSDNFYILLKDKNIKNLFNVCIDDVCESININSNRAIFVKNKYQIGDQINIRINDNHLIEDMYIAYIDFDRFKQNVNILNKNQLDITEFKDNKIKGNINVTDNEVLFLSIAYNDNFKIKVDGKETNYYSLFDNFIGLDLEKGPHTIEIEYEVKGLSLGVLVSMISLDLFLIYIYYNDKSVNKK